MGVAESLGAAQRLSSTLNVRPLGQLRIALVEAADDLRRHFQVELERLVFADPADLQGLAAIHTAFEELARRHQSRVYAVAYRITSNREDALDAAQESLVKAYRKIDSWRPTGGFSIS